MIDFPKVAAEVVEIARLAGAAILDIYEHSADIEIERKADNSPLTLADRRANQIICEGLQRMDLDFPIISEENRAVPYEVRKDYDYYWLVDPLDGTKEFINRNGEFTVNIALIHQEMPVLGVVYAPCLDEMYWGIKGGGAFMLKEGKEPRLESAPFSMSDVGLKLVCSRSHFKGATEEYVKQFVDPELVASGSSLKFLIIARGDAHIYPRLAPTSEWDTGAAQIVLEEAGGQVLQATNQNPLRYNKVDILNPHFVAYGQVKA